MSQRQVWAQVDIGRKRLMDESDAQAFGYDYEVCESNRELRGAPNIQADGRYLDDEQARSIFLQTGRRCETWGDLKHALAANGSRIVEKGDHVEQAFQDVPVTRDSEDARKAERILTDHIGPG